MEGSEVLKMKRKSVEVAEREKNRAREGKGKDNSLNSKPSTNNVQESKLILQLQQRDKKEYQEANDIVISAKDRIMRVFNEALVRIDKRNREIDEQQAVIQLSFFPQIFLRIGSSNKT